MPIKNCPSCNVGIFVDDTIPFYEVHCKHCKTASPCKNGEFIGNRVRKAEPPDPVEAGIVLTTRFDVANREIETELEVVSAECVYGMNIFKDIFAGVRDVVGGRSKAVQNTLRDARKTALTELKREASTIGADAVVGVDLDYHEISGGMKGGMIMLVASGTAVRLKAHEGRRVPEARSAKYQTQEAN